MNDLVTQHPESQSNNDSPHTFTRVLKTKKCAGKSSCTITLLSRIKKYLVQNNKPCDLTFNSQHRINLHFALHVFAVAVERDLE
jgi:hypothetical protein